ncbi:M20 family metallopeptidase [Elioraea sp.]|uniref:M20 family metallopeptidase n=1 Tax=Elioraea sp. TaxID=2185103 RepID=UPI0025C03662|nr:M20 family metallopeptidase [Elioraea sp.]
MNTVKGDGMDVGAMSARARAAIDTDGMVDLLRSMIAIPSQHFEEAAVAAFMTARMREVGFAITEMDVHHPLQEGRVTRQAIGRLAGTGGGPTVMVNGHLDVNVLMPGWTVDPHSAHFENGWIWGLGAQDDKGGLAAAFCAILAIQRAGIALRGDVLFCPVAAHKVGGTGTRTLVKQGVTADYCINLEHSANTIGSVIVGSVRVRLRTRTPGLFFRFTEEARAGYFNPIEQHAVLIGAFGPSLTPLPHNGWARFRPHPQLPGFPMIRYDAVTKDHYGTAADLVFQVRTVPGMTLESVTQDALAVVARLKEQYPALDCEVIVPANGPNDPFFMEPTALENDHPLVAAMIDGYRHATGQEPQVGGVERIGNFGDGNVLQAAGIPSVQFGPGDIKRYPEWPAPDERVHVDELVTTARTVAHTLVALCG